MCIYKCMYIHTYIHTYAMYTDICIRISIHLQTQINMYVHTHTHTFSGGGWVQMHDNFVICYMMTMKRENNYFMLCVCVETSCRTLTSPAAKRSRGKMEAPGSCCRTGL